MCRVGLGVFCSLDCRAEGVSGRKRAAGQPPDTSSSAWATSARWTSVSSWLSNHLRQVHDPRRPGPPTLALGSLPGHGASRSIVPMRSSSACSESTNANWLRTDDPAGKPFEIPRDVLADVAAALDLVLVEVDKVCRMPPQRVRHRPQVGRTRTSDPAKAAARSVNSHGRPRQPRPTTTPSHPVSATIRSASSADQMSPLPSTGTDVTASLSRAIADQSACP